MSAPAPPRRVRIGIDTGGTFTDVVAVDEETGATTTTKTPSTPADPADGFLAGVTKVLALLDLPGSAVTAVSHGTTVATNQLLQGELDRIGFITTEGYESVLEIARQSVPDGYGNSYFWVKPPRIVPADLVRAVGGRLDHRGAEVRPFSHEDAVAAAHFFRDAGVTTIGVCLLHSYADDGHEQAMLEVLRAEHPDAVVSISSQVLREYREYERSVTTLVDAAVKPKVGAYVTSIRRRLDSLAPGVPFYVMKSNGGVLSAEEVVHQPITTMLSGPAAGALGAALIASAAGFDRILTCDGGGTSTDVTVVVDGEPSLTTEGTVGSYPSKIPMIDVVTVGAGGGSVAWLSPEGTLKVGPRSAGADPGPICYGTGGTEPTVTDAHVVLGRIPPHLLGGEIPLSVPLATAGLEALGAQLGLSLERAATGILEISAWNQANALRQVTVARGLDVRDFTLTTFGGSGSLLACRLMDVLGLPRTLVPPNPGNVSAFGLLTVDVRNDYVQTVVARHADLDLALLTTVVGDLEGQARRALDGEGFAPGEQRMQRTADLRYVGQAFEVRVPVAAGDLDRAAVEDVATAFHAAHRQLYGYDFATDPRQAVEWVNLRVSGIGPIRRPDLVQLEPGDGDVSRARTGSRPVFFDAWADTPVYWRPHLAPGDVVTGPAVIEEFGSTVPVHPGFAAAVDGFGNLLLTRTETRPEESA
ncbi:hydantoinase/oxoprolinase family protein [Modestobacter sp. I12A-02628]|uniref:Hydantoinase/oxoprolinase family protein n=1 Tax=Goekera deserti TaxID=2497753 RepID=A0A7K3WJS0_9ACTN|nr:hydantoinase/oxoprolinase family protein [Goekera deserti]MPQ99987.1 hydantoinase/oxoprolinase family protein [Goekera deserti]NDI49766.1 hydantoinase/oxoprolinase family protein [Goekera deserti]NEL56616.1 hydantoinase/oxoprolinase family protein [Goekera deserti]